MSRHALFRPSDVDARGEAPVEVQPDRPPIPEADRTANSVIVGAAIGATVAMLLNAFGGLL